MCIFGDLGRTAILGDNVCSDVPTSEHNSFQVGNKRKVFVLFIKSSSYSYNHLFSIGECVGFDKYEKQTPDSIQWLS